MDDKITVKQPANIVFMAVESFIKIVSNVILTYIFFIWSHTNARAYQNDAIFMHIKHVKGAAKTSRVSIQSRDYMYS